MINPAKVTLESDTEKWNNYFLTSVPGKIIEQLPLDTTLRHMENNKVIGDS